MVTGEPYYGGSEPAAVPQYENTYQGSSQEGTASVTGQSSMGATGTDQLQQSASGVANQVQQAAGTLAGQAGDTAHVVLKDQRTNAAQSLNTVSNAISQVGQQLSQNDQTAPIAGVIGAAADQVQNVANYLEHHNVQQIVDEVRGFARREPALFLGGAFLVGLLAARFLKASSEQQQQEQFQQTQPFMWQTQRSSAPYGVYGYNRPIGGTYGMPAYYRGYDRRYGRTYAPTANFRQGPAYGQPAWYGPNTTGSDYENGNAVERGPYDPYTQR